MPQAYSTIARLAFHRDYAATAASPPSPRACATRPRRTGIVVSRRGYGVVEPLVEGVSLDDLNLKNSNLLVQTVKILR
jgi:hypothetical protein